MLSTINKGLETLYIDAVYVTTRSNSNNQSPAQPTSSSGPKKREQREAFNASRQDPTKK